MTLPTFFIIGAAKAGTTSLHFYLDQHPQIQMSEVKEPHFFAGPENGIPFPPERVGSREEYERLFDPAFEVRGEASPSYTNHPRRQGVPERIAELVPDAKLIYLVRDPIDRTVSHYQHSVAAGKERRPLQEALSDLSDPYSYLTCHSLYAQQLELYLSHFSKERIMVIDQTELSEERQVTLHRVFAFLSVDETFTTSQFDTELWKSQGRRVSPPGHDDFIKSVVTPRMQWIPQRIRRSARRSFERVFWSPLQTPSLDDETRKRLAAFYEGEVERLRALTGKTFPAWSV